MNPPILIVEDDDNDVLFLTMGLRKAGVSYPLQTVKDGREALDYFSGYGQFADREAYPLPYLVFLDLKLPGIMGLEVLRKIRQRPELDSTIVLVFTSSQQPEDIHTAYQLRANAYLVKPTGLEDLLPMISTIKDFWLTHNQRDPVPSEAQEVALR